MNKVCYPVAKTYCRLPCVHVPVIKFTYYFICEVNSPICVGDPLEEYSTRGEEAVLSNLLLMENIYSKHLSSTLTSKGCPSADRGH